MYCAKFSPQVTDLSQSSSSLPLDVGQSEEMLFEKFPDEKLFGEKFFCPDVGFDGTDMAYDFKIVKISGHVIWKYRPSSDVNARNAKLKIKRLRFSPSEETIFGELQLAEYDNSCSPDANGFIKQSFALSANSHKFWQQGENGMIELNHVALNGVCF